jgi:hypothetical protein
MTAIFTPPDAMTSVTTHDQPETSATVEEHVTPFARQDSARWRAPFGALTLAAAGGLVAGLAAPAIGRRVKPLVSARSRPSLLSRLRRRAEQPYAFKGGYPTADTVQQAYDDVDLVRAMQMYRVFYPSVSGAIFDGTAKVGTKPNKVFGSMDTRPRHVGFTLNSDTPYGAALLDLHLGPMVIELPPGPFVGAALDIHQRWLLDMGLPGPDAGRGGKHLIVPPDYKGVVPQGYNVATSSSFRVIGAIRAIPQNGDVAGALALLRAVKIYPLESVANWTDPTWIDMTPMPQDTTPHAWEDTLRFWQVLHHVVNSEPVVEDYRQHYGELASLGIAKGHPFAPDARTKRILEQAARNACAQMRVESFADRRPDRIVWSDRQWQWVSLRFENGTFDLPDYTDTYARDKWFFQAIAASPAMFRRGAGSGSL